MHFIRTVVYFLLSIQLASIAIGQVVSVEKVKFTSLKDDWLLAEVKISTNTNNLKSAESKRYVENVGFRLHLGFKNKDLASGLDIYYSEVTALILERGDKNVLRFYLPGKIIEKNRYNKPQFYYAEIIVNQKPLPPQRSAFSYEFKNEASLKKFVDMSKAASLRNRGRLMPSYLAPASIVKNDLDDPTYLRINY